MSLRPTASSLISIHTLTQRVTRIVQHKGGLNEYFNPHPHVEGDARHDDNAQLYADFNPHPHVEGDLTWAQILQLHLKISIHTLT